jgi:RNA polymerase sigma-70 factor (ECF subfamily)
MDLVFTGTTQNSMENSQILKNLVEKVQAGQTAAFGEIYNLYFEKVYRFIFYRVSHKELAEDLAEEVFIKIHKKINSVKESQAFEGWMYQIARNTVIDYYRSKKTLVSLDDIENTLEYETNIVDSLNLQSHQKILLKFLNQLPPDQQTVIKLKFLENLDNPEIAAILKKSEGAIRVIQHRALTQLQNLAKGLEKPF